jgi:lysozyme
MNISQAGIEAIKDYEGVRLKAYDDGVGVWTIGVGHIKGVKRGDEITMAQVDEFLRADLAEAEKAVNARVVVPLAQGQFDALVSFVFNLGGGAFIASTLLKKLNAGDYDAAADEFLRWNKAGGRVLAGLTKRRISERIMFLEGHA